MFVVFIWLDGNITGPIHVVLIYRTESRDGLFSFLKNKNQSLNQYKPVATEVRPISFINHSISLKCQFSSVINIKCFAAEPLNTPKILKSSPYFAFPFSFLHELPVGSAYITDERYAVYKSLVKYPILLSKSRWMKEITQWVSQKLE